MSILTPQQQAIRALLAGIDDTRFAALKTSLEQNRAAIDARIAVLDAARGQLALRKQQLDALLARMSEPNGLEGIRTTMLKGERLDLAVAKPKSPKPAAPARTVTAPRSGRTTTPRP